MLCHFDYIRMENCRNEIKPFQICVQEVNSSELLVKLRKYRMLYNAWMKMVCKYNIGLMKIFVIKNMYSLVAAMMHVMFTSGLSKTRKWLGKRGERRKEASGKWEGGREAVAHLRLLCP